MEDRGGGCGESPGSLPAASSPPPARQQGTLAHHWQAQPSTFVVPRRDHLRFGTNNLGNTCYLNSVLAMLGHCPPFARSMLGSAALGGLSLARIRALKLKGDVAANNGVEKVDWSMVSG